MKDFPNPFWAAMFIVFATVLAIIALLVPTQANVTMAVVAIASNIVSGSFGFISGHNAGVASILGQNTSISNPTTPVDPAKK